MIGQRRLDEFELARHRQIVLFNHLNDLEVRSAKLDSQTVKDADKSKQIQAQIDSINLKIYGKATSEPKVPAEHKVKTDLGDSKIFEKSAFKKIAGNPPPPFIQASSAKPMSLLTKKKHLLDIPHQHHP